MSADRILSQLLGSGAASGFAGGLAGGIASGLFTSKAGRKFGKKALKVGGIAAVGGLAYAAFQRYRDQQQSAPSAGAARPVRPAPPAAFLPAPGGAGAEELGMTLVRAMIGAARADGRLDARERHAIDRQLASLELSDGERHALRVQLDQPVDLDTLAAAAHTPEIAAEIYTASLLAIDVDTAAERAYLAMLAARLELPTELVDAIHRELAVSPTEAKSFVEQRWTA